MQLLYLFPELFQRGYIKLAQPPRYRFDTTNRGNYIYLRDEEAKTKFELEQIKKSIKVDNDLVRLTQIKDDYIRLFDFISSSKSISEDLMKQVLTPEDKESLEEILEELPGLNLIDSGNRIQGIYGGVWHDIPVDTLFTELEALENLFGTETKITLTPDLKKPKETQTFYPIDLFRWINTKFRFKYDYFKGLGEADPEELVETTIDPATRSEIVVTMDADRLDYYSERLDNFFSSKTKDVLARRRFVLENFEQGEE